MPDTSSAKKRWFFFITGFVIIILMALVIRVVARFMAMRIWLYDRNRHNA